MAAIADLRSRLHIQAWELVRVRHPEQGESFAGHVRAWREVAESASRALGPLRVQHNVDVFLEQVAGLHQPLTAPDWRVLQVGETLGAMADLIDADKATVYGAPLVARHRLHLSVQAALYASAQATLSLPAGPQPAQQRAHAALTRLSDATEVAALVPPSARESILDYLTPPVPDADTIDGAVRRWAATVTGVLRSQELVSGYALQRAATSIAAICTAAAEVTGKASRRGLLADREATDAFGALRSAADRWREAAIWPTHWRLGGRNPEVRASASDLDAALRGKPLSSLPLPDRAAAAWSAVHLASDVAYTHRLMLSRLAASGALWVAVAALPDSYLDRHLARRVGWVLQRTQDVLAPDELVNASWLASSALTRASQALDRAVQPGLGAHHGRLALAYGGITATEPCWETSPPARRRHQRRTPTPGSPTLPIGI